MSHGVVRNKTSSLATFFQHLKNIYVGGILLSFRKFTRLLFPHNLPKDT